MHAHPCDNWPLLLGRRVEIRRRRKKVRSGTVEAAAADSSILWLAAEGVSCRTLYAASEGYEVWVDPETLPDSLYIQVVCRSGRDRGGAESSGTAEDNTVL